MTPEASRQRNAAKARRRAFRNWTPPQPAQTPRSRKGFRLTRKMRRELAGDLSGGHPYTRELARRRYRHRLRMALAGRAG